MRRNVFRRKIGIPALIHIFLWDESCSEAQQGSPLKFFRTVRQNNFDKKSWYFPPALLSINLNDIRSFLKHRRRVPVRSFLVSESEIFHRKIVILPPSHPYAFSKPHFLWNTEGFFREVFRYCEITNFATENLDTPSLPTSYPKNYPVRESFWSTEGFLRKKIRYCETKKLLDGKYWQCPPLIHKIVRHQKFSETQKGSRTKYFGTLSQKDCNRK